MLNALLPQRSFLDVYLLCDNYIQLCAGALGNPLVRSQRSLRVLPIGLARVIKWVQILKFVRLTREYRGKMLINQPRDVRIVLTSNNCPLLIQSTPKHSTHFKKGEMMQMRRIRTKFLRKKLQPTDLF